MDEKIGQVFINEEFYSGDDLYSDGVIEDYILDICKNKRQEEVIRTSNEWAILYHLSDIRENLLDWYPFTKQDEILEIGSGCGAITGLLSRKAKSVVCVELSKKRSLINAYRNSDCNNVTIMLGNFENIDLKQQFDYITLIGVWEYSGLYLQGDAPYLKMIETLKKYLKPQGKIIIAIENKMGLKYWNGAPEDHTGKLYSGINDYIGEKKVRTFSKPEIEELLKEAGFEHLSFYYPMPDYKLPDTIYSERILPAPGDIRCYRSNYNTCRVYNFLDATAYDQICRDGMFSYFANSFLVVCGMESESLEFAKYSRDRRPEFRVATEIRSIDGKRYVVKKALHEKALDHIRRMKKMERKWKSVLADINCLTGELVNDTYVTPYVEGIDIDTYLYSWRNNIEEFVLQTRNMIKFYLTPQETDFIDFKVTEEYRSIFGDYYPDNAKSLKITNVDCIFSNMKLVEGFKAVSFDCEWIFDFPIPYEYVLWRTLNRLYIEYMVYLREQLSKKEFLMKFGISPENALVFEKMERVFMDYVHGKNGEERYLKNYRKGAFMQNIRWV